MDDGKFKHKLIFFALFRLIGTQDDRWPEDMDHYPSGLYGSTYSANIVRVGILRCGKEVL